MNPPMNSKLRNILAEAALDYSLSSRTDSKEVVITEAEKAIIALIADRERLARIDTAEKLRYALHPHKGATGIIDNEIATLRNQLSRKEQTDE